MIKPKVILTDIEGTTTSISFVHDVLFPYSHKALPSFVRENVSVPIIATILEQVRTEIGNPTADVEILILKLLNWIEEDVKVTPLKTLQGLIWENGYLNGEIQGHLYEDAYQELISWYEQGIRLCVYSSGSIKAQKLLFQHSIFGDVSYLFEQYFDTTTGQKKEAGSYSKISQVLDVAAREILFLSDVEAELRAGAKIGMGTMMVARETKPQTTFIVAENFPQVSQSIFCK